MTIKTWQQRCEEHPDHNGIVSDEMIRARMQEEIDELRAAIEQAEPNEFSPNWDQVEPLQEALREQMAEVQRLRGLLNQSETRLHEVAVHCERVERRLKDANTAAMNLTRDLVCMDYDDDDRLDRDRVMERIMQWRNQWDKAMFKEQT